jgi:hypothetical protein
MFKDYGEKNHTSKNNMSSLTIVKSLSPFTTHMVVLCFNSSKNVITLYVLGKNYMTFLLLTIS